MTSAQNLVPSLRTRQPSSSTLPSDAALASSPMRPSGLALLRRVEDREVLPDDFGRRVPLGSLGTGVPGADASVRAQEEDRVILDGLDEQSERLLTRRLRRDLAGESRVWLLLDGHDWPSWRR